MTPDITQMQQNNLNKTLNIIKLPADADYTNNIIKVGDLSTGGGPSAGTGNKKQNYRNSGRQQSVASRMLMLESESNNTGDYTYKNSPTNSNKKKLRVRRKQPE